MDHTLSSKGLQRKQKVLQDFGEIVGGGLGASLDPLPSLSPDRQSNSGFVWLIYHALRYIFIWNRNSAAKQVFGATVLEKIVNL